MRREENEPTELATHPFGASLGGSSGPSLTSSVLRPYGSLRKGKERVK